MTDQHDLDGQAGRSESGRAGLKADTGRANERSCRTSKRAWTSGRADKRCVRGGSGQTNVRASAFGPLGGGRRACAAGRAEN